MVWDNKRLHQQLAALRIILFIFIEHYRHRVMCQRENVGSPNVLVTSGKGGCTLSVGHIHRLPFPPLLSGKGWATWVSLSFMLVFEFVILGE